MKKKVYNDEITSLIKIFAAVAIVFVAFIGVTYLVTGEKGLQIPKATYSNEIQFSEILAGEILNQSSSEYYVLAFFEDDQYNVAYEAYLTKLNAKSAIKKYVVNLDRFFNKASVSENSNLTDSLIFSKSTLLKISNNKVSESYEGNTAIIDYLAGKIK